MTTIKSLLNFISYMPIALQLTDVNHTLNNNVGVICTCTSLFLNMFTEKILHYTIFMSYETEICTLKWKDFNFVKDHFLSLAITSKVNVIF